MLISEIMTWTRRNFLKDTALLGLSMGPLAALGVDDLDGYRLHLDTLKVPLKWLDSQNPSIPFGATFGVPWSRGEVKREDCFVIEEANGNTATLQNWPLAFWPDGSVKWSAFALADGSSLHTDEFYLRRRQTSTKETIILEENQSIILIDNGILRLQFAKRGQHIIEKVWINNKLVAKDILLNIQVQDKPDTDATLLHQKKEWISTIDHTVLENQGTERVLVRVEGSHQDVENQRKFPFILRFYIYRNLPTVKTIYTFLYDGDEQHDFIKGIGLSVRVPLEETPTYNRFVRFVGERLDRFETRPRRAGTEAAAGRKGDSSRRH